VQNLASIFNRNRLLARSDFETKQHVEDVKHLSGQPMIDLRCDPDISPTPS